MTGQARKPPGQLGGFFLYANLAPESRSPGKTRHPRLVPFEPIRTSGVESTLGKVSRRI
jgi:hypothetical protein